MLIYIMLFAAFLIGLVLTFGPDACTLFLEAVGSFERLSWFSLIGTAVLLGYWVVYAVSLYRQANSYYVEEEEESPSGSENGAELPPSKVGKRALIFGLTLTVGWVGLFICSEVGGIAADGFNNWRTIYSEQLQIAREFGRMLLAYAVGIFVTLLYMNKKRESKSSSSSGGRK